MSKEIIQTDQAPRAIGTYSQAVKVGQTVYISGQIPLDPETMQIVGQTAAEQTRQVLSNINAVLVAAGSDFSKVVKTTIFLKQMSDFASVNEIYAEYFKIDPPARSTVEVARLPKEVLVEIECISVIWIKAAATDF